MRSFNDSGEETLPADCLALSVFSLNTALHQTQLYTRFSQTHTHTHTVFPTVVPHRHTAACIHTLHTQGDT